MNSRTYSEVYQILQYLPEDEYIRIPDWQINYFKENMDKSVGKIFSINTNIKEVKLSLDAQKILLKLYYLYIANDSQRTELENVLLNEKKEKITQNYNEIFKHNEKNNKDLIQKDNKNTALNIVKKSTFFDKLKNFFNRLLKK